MYKLLITLWGRPHITDLCFKGVKRLQKLGVDPICIYSDKENEKLVKKYGFEGYFYKNKPIGEKLNFGIEKALESKWEYIMQIGSDDLITDDLLDLYKPFIEKKEKAFGINTVHFYDMKTGKSAKSKNPYAFGCGRMIHRSCFDKKYQYKVKILKGFAGKDFHYGKGTEKVIGENWMRSLVKSGLAEVVGKVDINTQLWNDNRNRSLDFDSQYRLSMMGVKVKAIDVDKVYCVDLKSEQNIWDFDFFDEIDECVIDNIPEKDAIREVRQIYYDKEFQHK